MLQRNAQSPEVSISAVVSDVLLATKILVDVDAAPTEGSALSCTEKNSTETPTLGSSAPSYSIQAVEGPFFSSSHINRCRH